MRRPTRDSPGGGGGFALRLLLVFAFLAAPLWASFAADPAAHAAMTAPPSPGAMAMARVEAGALAPCHKARTSGAAACDFVCQLTVQTPAERSAVVPAPALGRLRQAHPNAAPELVGVPAELPTPPPRLDRSLA